MEINSGSHNKRLNTSTTTYNFGFGSGKFKFTTKGGFKTINDLDVRNLRTSVVDDPDENLFKV